MSFSIIFHLDCFFGNMIPWFLIHIETVDSQQSGPQGVGPNADRRGMYWG